MIDCRITTKGAALTGDPAAIVRRNMRAAMHEAVQFGVRAVKGRTPQGVMGAQGGLLASIQGEVRAPGGDILGIVGTPSIYGPVVEAGRKPGGKLPPKGTMVRWIEVKMGLSTEEAKGVEYPVRRAIARKGTAGAHMFAETLDQDAAVFERIFTRHGLNMIRELSR
ncbi:hypothetical protein [Desulfobulbus elongatus]|uniref:hypothetical protein n=1 Tax=Desulfobulbus elongatus TaxID=53332 RepID=UPI00048618DA|nr:hypothetical protein [Desulfobulbus elongatus]